MLNKLKRKIIKWVILLGLPFIFVAIIIGAISEETEMAVMMKRKDEESKNANNIATFNDRENTIYSFFKGKGLDDKHISAILGNMQGESNVDNTSVETIFSEPYQIGPKKQDAQSKDFLISSINPAYAKRFPKIKFCGIGLCQWTNDRNRYLINLANAKGTHWSDINTQLELFWMEFCPSATRECNIPMHWSQDKYAQFLALQDIGALTEFFMNYFEGLHNNGTAKQRITYANGYLDKIKSGKITTTKNYIKYAIDIANDNTHGYCQTHRTGPDYDCSSLVYFSLVNTGNLPQTCCFSTSGMRIVLQNSGFKTLPYNPNDLKEGDILLRSGHTEMYIGNGQNVGAHQDTSGGITCKAGQGDQSGNEINVSANSGGWTYTLRK